MIALYIDVETEQGEEVATVVEDAKIHELCEDCAANRANAHEPVEYLGESLNRSKKCQDCEEEE